MIIFLHNLRVIALAVLVGAFTFGVVGFLIFMLPWAFISFIAAQLSFAGADPATFLLATVVPHATIELPTLLLITAAILRWQTAVIAPAPDQTVSESWLEAAADTARLFVGVLLPLLLLAAFVEAYITPLIVFQTYGA